MGERTIKYCDRCGKQMSYIGWTAVFKNDVTRIGKRIFLHSVYDGNLTGYDYTDYGYELCNHCTNELMTFLREKGESK